MIILFANFDLHPHILVFASMIHKLVAFNTGNTIICIIFCHVYWEFQRWKPFLEILKTQWEKDETPWKARIDDLCFFVNISEHTQFFFLFPSNILRNFSSVFRRFLNEFSIFLKIPIRRDRKTMPMYNCVPSFESIKLMPIIETKMGQTEGQNVQLFIKLFVLLESNYDLL